MRISNACLAAAAVTIFTACSTSTGRSAFHAPIHLYQTVQKNECVLSETGDGVKVNPLKFYGKVRDRGEDEFECEVIVPKADFERLLGICFASGHSLAAGYFVKREIKPRNQSCDSRPLTDGNFYFSASGIDQDSCSWACIPK